MRTNTVLGVIVGLACLTSIGCAPQTTWVKPDGTPQLFQSDYYDCKQKIFTMYGGVSQMGFGHAVMLPGEMRECLRARGWTEEDVVLPPRDPSQPSGAAAAAAIRASYEKEREEILRKIEAQRHDNTRVEIR